ncbi:hypothetical protein AUP68_03835 [Ilyonectria robusta]
MNPTMYGDAEAAKDRLRAILKGSPTAPASKEPKSGKEAPSLGVEHVDWLIRGNINGGLTYLYQQTREDPNMFTPTDRAYALYWMCAKNPLVIRALKLSRHNVRQEHEHVLVKSINLSFVRGCSPRPHQHTTDQHQRLPF